MRVHEMTITNEFQPQYLQWISHRASRYRSDIRIRFEKDNIMLDAKSILGMMILPFRPGTVITVQTKGTDEEEAIEEMCNLLELKPTE